VSQELRESALSRDSGAASLFDLRSRTLIDVIEASL
jgi:hypothetical protein